MKNTFKSSRMESKKILDLMAQIAKDKAAKQADLRERWKNGTIENAEVMK